MVCRLREGPKRSGDDRQNDGVEHGQCDGSDQGAEAAATQLEATHQVGGQPENSGVDEDAEQAKGKYEEGE